MANNTELTVNDTSNTPLVSPTKKNRALKDSLFQQFLVILQCNSQRVAYK